MDEDMADAPVGDELAADGSGREIVKSRDVIDLLGGALSPQIESRDDRRFPCPQGIEKQNARAPGQDGAKIFRDATVVGLRILEVEANPGRQGQRRGDDGEDDEGRQPRRRPAPRDMALPQSADAERTEGDGDQTEM